MIADVIGFLRDRLNTEIGHDPSGGSQEDLFVYVKASRDDAVSFASNAVSILLVRIEEETTLRPADRYLHASGEGNKRTYARVEPEIRMNLFVLFVARFPDDYGLSLQHLSRVVRYFQNHRVFTQESWPELPANIPQLVLELVTPSFSEQNEIWGALRVSYQPSALYKVKMIVFADETGIPVERIEKVVRTVVQKVVQVSR